MENGEIVVLVRLKAKPGMEGQLRQELVVGRARSEPGVLGIVVHEDINDPGHLVLYETFASQDAFNNYLALPYHQAFEKKSQEFLAEPTEMDKYKDTQMVGVLLRKTDL